MVLVCRDLESKYLAGKFRVFFLVGGGNKMAIWGCEVGSGGEIGV